MNTDDKKINPDYYTKGIQTTDYIESHDLGFCAGNIVKYVTRYMHKNPENPLEDLEKAQKYIEILIQKHTPYPTQKHKMAEDYKEALAKLKAGTL